MQDKDQIQEQESNKLKVGDALKSLVTDMKTMRILETVSTIVDIVDRPEDDHEAAAKISEIARSLKGTSKGVIDGKNLLDNERIRHLVDPKKFYITER